MILIVLPEKYASAQSGVGVAVGSGVGAGVQVGIGVHVGAGVGVGVHVGTGVHVGSGRWTGVGVHVGTGVHVGGGSGVAVGRGVGVGGCGVGVGAGDAQAARARRAMVAAAARPARGGRGINGTLLSSTGESTCNSASVRRESTGGRAEPSPVLCDSRPNRARRGGRRHPRCCDCVLYSTTALRGKGDGGDSRLRGNDGTLRALPAVPSPAAFAASSPLVGRGGCGACAFYKLGRDSRLRGNDGYGALARLWIPAYAGMTVCYVNAFHRRGGCALR